jgi:hypothetical protein
MLFFVFGLAMQLGLSVVRYMKLLFWVLGLQLGVFGVRADD